ncbi:MAG: zinc ribbon domain-containing protein [Defluviitaleaceae bacterium]|nr:zinc ribbon domain-containing protein [Defluviitaleaceae bacterium]
MIIYGTRHFRFKKATSTQPIYCNHCHNSTYWEQTNIWSWFTLFFIPIFPYWRKQIIICPVCEYGIKLTRKNREEVLKSIDFD